MAILNIYQKSPIKSSQTSATARPLWQFYDKRATYGFSVILLTDKHGLKQLL